MSEYITDTRVTYCHKVNGRFYFASGDKYKSLEEYKAKCKYAYGKLSGVKFFEMGKDYDKAIVIGDNFYPVKDGHYVGV